MPVQHRKIFQQILKNIYVWLALTTHAIFEVCPFVFPAVSFTQSQFLEGLLIKGAENVWRVHEDGKCYDDCYDEVDVE
jgi:hypothetical protein